MYGEPIDINHNAIHLEPEECVAKYGSRGNDNSNWIQLLLLSNIGYASGTRHTTK